MVLKGGKCSMKYTLEMIDFSKPVYSHDLLIAMLIEKLLEKR